MAYTDDAIETAVFTSSRYIPDRFLPDKAIDLIDEAGARVKLRQTTLPADLADIQKRIKFIVHRMENAIANHEFEKARFYSDEERKERENMRQLREKYNLDDSSTGCVTKDDIEDVVARWTGVPMTSIKEEEITKLLRIEEELHKRIISQEKAISALARAIRRSRAGLKSSSRPAGSFLFLGPTGVGKTEVARALAGFLFGSEKSLIRFDMSEFMEKHSVSKLIGSPPGYVGYEEGGQLTERVKRNPVFDHPAGRNREGPSGYLQHPAAGVRRRPVDRRPGQPGGFQEHHHHHDLQPGRALPRKARPPGLLGAARAKASPRRSRTWCAAK